MIKNIFVLFMIFFFGLGAARAEQLIITPTVQGSANDQGPQDGVFDIILAPPNDRQLFNNGFQQSRFAFEIDLSPVPANAEITSADLQLCISNWEGIREVELHGYEANGVIQLADFAQDGYITSKNLQPVGSQLYSADVSGHISGLLSSAAGFAGYNIREIFPGFNYLVMTAAEPGCGIVNPLQLVIDFTSAIPVSIDFQPGNETNTVNVGSSGVVSVAILGASDFDVNSVDPETIYLSGATVRLAGKSGNGMCHIQDVSGDGIDDLICLVETAQFLIEPGDSIVELTAQTHDGSEIEGSDKIRIVP